MAEAPAPRLAAAFYGDDVTGSTDALAQYHRAGLRSLLLFGTPGAAELRELAARYDVIGVAGVARSLPTDRMEDEVGPALTALGAAGPRLVQYKICSTADSSPEVGSLGRAIEIGRTVFGRAPVPVLAAQPEFGRYTAFGHHFAAEAGTVHRLDRQPTMSRHPVTPMTEADLRLHLGRQTSLPIGSFDLTGYELPRDQARIRYLRLLSEAEPAPGALVFDAVTQAHLVRAAELILAGRSQVYALGSGGLSHGVATRLAPAAAPPAPGPPGVPRPPGASGAGGPVLVVSGSCAPRTAEQIRHALAHGWHGIPLDPEDGASPAALARVRDATLRALARAPGAVVHTALGPLGPARVGPNPLSFIGPALAHLVAEAVAHAGVRRVVVAGGDTAGRVIRALGARSAEIDTLLGPGVALCRLGAAHAPLDGVRILLKGGQAGEADLFRRVGGAEPAPPGPRHTGAR
ncbi:four-carbon acid sugar kinase family protein [Streptomyces hoynatensis]|uniref:Four-carbon acid sugar kinase family protein n=1 Tax=Streptomyces hoynatensis TaxID=1141874 RepID=A0A3A9Z9P7_9ACTN|nr:four-carbon acid sugar kinase family protein [Streptomyces hoynatensis]RKN44948.1 four-carbon acid sugar kinase family protein [Streptomyces hoynatensis]